MAPLLIATTNEGKIRELRELLRDCGWEIVTPAEVGVRLAVEESGATYRANAQLKARAFCTAGGLPALADDSGLEVDALDGAPGVLSARFDGPDTSHDDKMKRVLAELAARPQAPRTARFRAVVVVAFPGGGEITGEGVCEGAIAEQPRGSGGFGYDPIFVVGDGPLTMAELPAHDKNLISHRARAILAVRDALKRAVYDGPGSAASAE